MWNMLLWNSSYYFKSGPTDGLWHLTMNPRAYSLS